MTDGSEFHEGQDIQRDLTLIPIKEHKKAQIRQIVRSASDEEVSALAEDMALEQKDTNYREELQQEQINRENAAREKAESMATYDTTVKNALSRIGFLDMFRKTLQIQLRKNNLKTPEETQLAGSLLFLDLDHFKIVNDTLGHNTGDRLLITLGKILDENLRPGDLFGRYGGEEFLVYLPGAETDDAVKVADRIRKAVKGTLTPLVASTKEAQTVSIGVNTLPQDAESYKEFLRRIAENDENDMAEILSGVTQDADRAMYAAKEGGRDQVCVSIPNGLALEPSLARAVITDSNNIEYVAVPSPLRIRRKT